MLWSLCSIAAAGGREESYIYLACIGLLSDSRLVGMVTREDNGVTTCAPCAASKPAVSHNARLFWQQSNSSDRIARYWAITENELTVIYNTHRVFASRQTNVVIGSHSVWNTRMSWEIWRLDIRLHAGYIQVTQKTFLQRCIYTFWKWRFASTFVKHP